MRINEPENITVIDVCKAAGINRSTFYAHFNNMDSVYELINFNLIELLDAIPLGQVSVDYDLLCHLCKLIYNKRQYFITNIEMGIDTNFSVIFKRLYGIQNEEDLDLMSSFWTGLCNKAIEVWIKDYPNYSPEGCARFFIDSVIPTIRNFRTKEVIANE